MTDFNRKQTKQDLGDFLYRYKVRYETESCEPFSLQGMELQQRMLQAIVDSPELLMCGRGRFRELKMLHDGSCWIVELQRDEQETHG